MHLNQLSNTDIGLIIILDVLIYQNWQGCRVADLRISLAFREFPTKESKPVLLISTSVQCSKKPRCSSLKAVEAGKAANKKTSTFESVECSGKASFFLFWVEIFSEEPVLSYHRCPISVMRVGSDTFGDPIYIKIHAMSVRLSVCPFF